MKTFYCHSIFYGFWIIVIVSTFYFYLFNCFYSLKSNSIINKCRIYKVSNICKDAIKNFRNGNELWKYLMNVDIKHCCSFFSMMSFFSNKRVKYYHRVYENINNLSVEGIFPDKSFSRLIPKNKKNFKNVLSHTYKVQDFLYSYQHPINCEDKKYLIIKGYGSGHGSEIHVITSYLALAISLNRIAILDPYFKSMKGYGEYCKKHKNWLCFLEQLTNCSLNKEIYLNSEKLLYENQTEKYLYVGGTLKYRNIIPHQVLGILKHSPITKRKLIHYWRIQASTYIFRLNERTNDEVDNLIYLSLKNNLYNGCFNMWVRHGDKYKEMKLLNVEDYIPSYELYSRIIHKNIPIYLSTDDPNVTEYFNNYKKAKTYYLNFKRNNGNLGSNIKRGAEMTLNFISDVKAALYCEAFSGTRSSNVVRLIDELRSTVGLSANSFYFENGGIKISNTSYEHIEYW